MTFSRVFIDTGLLITAVIPTLVAFSIIESIGKAVTATTGHSLRALNFLMLPSFFIASNQLFYIALMREQTWNPSVSGI